MGKKKKRRKRRAVTPATPERAGIYLAELRAQAADDNKWAQFLKEHLGITVSQAESYIAAYKASQVAKPAGIGKKKKKPSALLQELKALQQEHQQTAVEHFERLAGYLKEIHMQMPDEAAFAEQIENANFGFTAADAYRYMKGLTPEEAVQELDKRIMARHDSALLITWGTGKSSLRWIEP